MLTLEAIREKAVPIAKMYNVKHMKLFGSYADGTATEDSDVDLLVEFNEPPVASIMTVMGLQLQLSESFGKAVDVVPLPAPRPERLVLNRTEVIL
ncbi:MAG: nucleotidyltransferase domain-containing protein [Oscillospiraceae bacterium]|nr:nucleotidyltransferase domain-containing protein [Oscillospiraceae bacterium]